MGITPPTSSKPGSDFTSAAPRRTLLIGELYASFKRFLPGIDNSALAAGDKDTDTMSTTGTAVFYNGALVEALSKRQTSTSLSSVEAEIYALACRDSKKSTSGGLQSTRARCNNHHTASSTSGQQGRDFVPEQHK